MCLDPRRQCTDHPSSNELHQADQLGLVPRIVVDLRKFLALGHVASLDTDDQGRDTMPLPLEIREGLKTVAGFAASTSPRVNLLLRASAPLRTSVGENKNGLELGVQRPVQS